MSDLSSTTVVVAMADERLGSQLATELSAASDIEVVARSDDGSALFEVLRDLVPDVVLLGTDLTVGAVKECDAVELCARVSDLLPVCRVVLVVGDDDEPPYAAVAAGAAGACTTSELAGRATDLVRQTARGEATLPKEWATRVLDEYAALQTDESLGQTPPRLTATEREVLQRIAKGATVGSIAGLHGVPPRLVRLHARFALAKLHRAAHDEAALSDGT